MSACGVTLHALLPFTDDAQRAKVVYGVLASLIGAALVLRGRTSAPAEAGGSGHWI